MPWLPRSTRKDRPSYSTKWGKSSNQSFYNSKLWRNIRAQHIRTSPICVVHNAAGIVVTAQVVDHVIPISAGGSHTEPKNLQSLCHSCHNKKSIIEQNWQLEYEIDPKGKTPTLEAKNFVITELIRFL